MKQLKLIHILFFLLQAMALAMIISSVTAIQQYSVEQKTTVCSVLNLTFSDCYLLWQYYDDYANGNLTKTVYVTNFTTQYVNVTVDSNYTVTDFEQQKAQFDQDYRMKQLDVDLEKAKLAVQPVSPPVTTPPPSLSGEVYTKEQLDQKIADALSQKSQPIGIQKQTDYFSYLPYGAILLIGGLFVYRKFKNKSPSYSNYDHFPPQIYKAKPMEERNAEEHTKEGDQTSSQF